MRKCWKPPGGFRLSMGLVFLPTHITRTQQQQRRASFFRRPVMAKMERLYQSPVSGSRGSVAAPFYGYCNQYHYEVSSDTGYKMIFHHLN